MIREVATLERLGIAREQKADRADACEQDGAGEIGVGETGHPRRVRGQCGEHDLVDAQRIARTHALPGDVIVRCRTERGEVGRRRADVAGIEKAPGMQCSEHRRGTADVICVRMRQHEQRERAAPVREVRHDGRTARIAAEPAPARVDEYPVIAARPESDGVSLPDVEHV